MSPSADGVWGKSWVAVREYLNLKTSTLNEIAVPT